MESAEMKLCMVNGYYHPFTGGTEKHMFELGRRLARTEEIHVVTSKLEGTPEFEVIQGIKIHRLRTWHLKMPFIYPPPMPLAMGVMQKIIELDKEHDFDAFNLHGRWFPAYNMVVDYANKKGKLMVLTLHNQRPIGISRTIATFGKLYEMVIGREVLRNVDRIISVSAAAKKDIMLYGLAGEKITVIHNGVDVNFYKPSPPILRKKYKDGCDNLLMFVGRIIQQKGLGYLMAAMPDVLKEFPSTKLVIVGKGKQLGEIKSAVKRRGLENSVIFPGFVDESQMPSLYSSADIFVLPSLWEVLPIALLEALACGVPLAASDAGGNPEIVENGKNGFIFKRADKDAIVQSLTAMLADKNKMLEMGRKSREIACRKFDWEIIKNRTLLFYGEALKEHYAR